MVTNQCDSIDLITIKFIYCWYSFWYGDVSPGDTLLGSDLLPQSCKKNKQLVGGADYAHSDA
jgi:hypothetical protein